jgi:hypothetical protein
MSDSKQAGFVRISQLMVQMMDAVEEGNKERLVKLSQHFAEDAEDFVGVLLEAAGVTDEDMERFCPDDVDELLKDAASADQIRTASVKA